MGRRHALCALVLGLVIVTVLNPMGTKALQGPRPTVIFLHHSCGLALIDEGGVREGLTARGYDFYDHGYNEEGLRLPDGSHAGRNFDVPGDNTDPDGFAAIFAQPLHDPPDNTFSHLMQYDVIAFKSCFPTSNIADDEQLEVYKAYYLAIRDRMDAYPQKAFVIVTQPPQVPGSSDRQEAARARAWTEWLRSEAFLGGREKVFVFDFFGYLAGEDNFLRREYRYDNYDAHPNARANREIGPAFVDFIDGVASTVEPGAAPVEPEATEELEVTAESEVVVPQPIEVDAGGTWEPGSAGPENRVSCEQEGEGGVRMAFDLIADGYGDCGRYFETAQNWSEGDGFAFEARADGEGSVIVTLFSGPTEAPTPFDAVFELRDGESSTPYFLGWQDFVVASWADEGGLSILDPWRITGYSFTVDAYEAPRELTLWVEGAGPVKAGDVPPEVEAPEEEPVPIAEEPEEKSGGGTCPAALALPALLVTVAVKRRRTTRGA